MSRVCFARSLPRRFLGAAVVVILALPVAAADVSTSPNDFRAKALLARGDALQYDRRHHVEDYRAAVAQYDEALALPSVSAPIRALAFAQRAGPLMRLGELSTVDDEKLAWFREGMRSAERGIALDDRCAWCWFWKGACLARWGQTKGLVQSAFALGELRESLEKAVALDPSHLDARLALGQLDRQVPRWFGGDPARAEALFRRVLRDEPRFTRAMLDLAELLAETEREEEARVLARNALEERRPSRPGEHRKFDAARARALLRELGETP